MRTKAPSTRTTGCYLWRRPSCCCDGCRLLLPLPVLPVLPFLLFLRLLLAVRAVHSACCCCDCCLACCPAGCPACCPCFGCWRVHEIAAVAVAAAVVAVVAASAAAADVPREHPACTAAAAVQFPRAGCTAAPSSPPCRRRPAAVAGEAAATEAEMGYRCWGRRPNENPVPGWTPSRRCSHLPASRADCCRRRETSL